MTSMQAIESEVQVAAAIKRWVKAFKKYGQRPVVKSPETQWVKASQVWLRSRGTVNHRGVYWNGLGVHVDSHSLQNEVVQVNPPVAGSPPGNCQGVVARDTKGAVWLLHRGRMNVAQQRVVLRDYLEDAKIQSIDPVAVTYEDGSKLECFPVACLDQDDISIIAATKRFVDLCRIARTAAVEGREAADILRQTVGFEEPTGSYTIPARNEIVAERIHAEVFAALKRELAKKSIDHTNEKISLLGPDLYTLGHPDPMLFEIKTGNVADDVLKAVGQLVVYERLLGDSRRKIIVVPVTIRDDYRSLLEGLDIEILHYVRAKKDDVSFSWPDGFWAARKNSFHTEIRVATK